LAEGALNMCFSEENAVSEKNIKIFYGGLIVERADWFFRAVRINTQKLKKSKFSRVYGIHCLQWGVSFNL